MRKIIFISFILCLLMGCSSNSYQKISMDEAYKAIMLDDSIKVIDVRTEEEYTTGHIPKALNIPLDNINAIDLDKKTTIYVYCQSGSRSQEASQKLTDLGYTSVYDMGGLNNWSHELEK